MEGENNQVQFVVSRCRMSKRFSREAGSGADPESKTPQRDKLLRVTLSRAPTHQDAARIPCTLSGYAILAHLAARMPPKTGVSASS